MDGGDRIYDLAQWARTGDLATLPKALCDHLGHTSGPVAGNGYAIVSIQSDKVDIGDRVLEDLGLGLKRRDGSAPLQGRASQAVASLRLGLLYRMLDMAFAHLSGRKSFGVKTTAHQLVRAEFSELHIEATLLASAISLGQLSNLNPKITGLSHRADRLMGGHGFLLGQTHSVSYLSDLYCGQCDNA